MRTVAEIPMIQLLFNAPLAAFDLSADAGLHLTSLRIHDCSSLPIMTHREHAEGLRVFLVAFSHNPSEHAWLRTSASHFGAALR
jgi:hypothetical protein